MFIYIFDLGQVNISLKLVDSNYSYTLIIILVFIQ